MACSVTGTWEVKDDTRGNGVNTGEDGGDGGAANEEGSVGLDFQWAHVLALDKFMDGLPSCLQIIILMA